MTSFDCTIKCLKSHSRSIYVEMFLNKYTTQNLLNTSLKNGIILTLVKWQLYISSNRNNDNAIHINIYKWNYDV